LTLASAATIRRKAAMNLEAVTGKLSHGTRTQTGMRSAAGSKGWTRGIKANTNTCFLGKGRTTTNNTTLRLRVGAPSSYRSLCAKARKDARRRSGSCKAGGSDLSSLFDGTSSAKKTGADGATKKQKESSTATSVPEEVELKSDAGFSYELLRDLLAAGEWEKADDETRLKLIQLAGEEAVLRDWVYFTEVKDIPVADLKTIDNLWSSYSEGRYGYSVQKKVWIKNRKVWSKMFKEIDWVQGENNAYRKWPLEFDWKKDAKKGHLPLTNCLRGTQLFQAVLEHPAFQQKKKKVATSIEKNSVKI
jgi:hypothetical protein